MKNKIYLSSSKLSNPQDYTLLHEFWSGVVDIEIKTFEGGLFQPESVDDCRAVVIIPPKTSTLSWCQNMDEKFINVGRGQADIINRALRRKQIIVVYKDGVFYQVESIAKIDQNWSDAYGSVIMKQHTEYSGKINSLLSSYHSSNARSTSSRSHTATANVSKAVSVPLMAALFISPNTLKK